MDKKTKNSKNKKHVDDSIAKMKRNADSDMQVHEISKIVSTNKSSKRILDEDSELDKLVPQLEKKKQKIKKAKDGVPNNKIIFNENEEQCEVANTAEPADNKKKNKTKFLNEDEADVKEEDIDKFCDEITEEDNEQYEDWVKLIEAKLHSNKKSK